MSQLTDRYVSEVLHRVPTADRADVEHDLRDSITSTVAQHAAAGESGATAEAAALTELGDPLLVASTYGGRPAYLIGPDLYGGYWRLVRLLLAVVPGTVAVVVGVVQSFAGTPLGQVALNAVGLFVAVAIQVAFWTTVAFALVERYGSPQTLAEAHDEWTVADLPEPTDRRIGMGDTMAAVFLQLLGICFLTWQMGLADTTPSDVAATQFLDPSLADFWLPFFVVVLSVAVLFELIKAAVGHWTVSLAIGNTIVNAIFVVPLVWLLVTQPVLNPAFAAAMGWDVSVDSATSIQQGVAVLVILGTAWDCADGWWRALRADT